MPSIIQKKSYNSVQVYWLNKGLVQEKIREAVKQLSVTCPEVQKVILFGSVAESCHTVSSDVDILIVIKEAGESFLSRPLRYKDFFKEVGLGIDLFVYTQDEIKRNNIPLVNTAFKKGKILFDSSCREKF